MWLVGIRFNDRGHLTISSKQIFGEPMKRRLDISKIAYGAFLVPWWNWRSFVKALSVPLVVLTVVIQGWRYTWEQLLGWGNWLAWALYGIVFVLCVTTCHRLALLNVPLIQIPFFPKWTWRETRFYLLMIAVLLICAAAGSVALTVVVALLPRLVEASDENILYWIRFAVKFPVLYLFARLSLVFPATAIDRKVSLKRAWEETTGNGWRLVLVVALLPWVFSQIIGFLYREEASAMEVFVLTILTCALFAVEVVALSLSYRELTQDDNSKLTSSD